jgi:hypothetical protein
MWKPEANVALTPEEQRLEVRRSRERKRSNLYLALSSLLFLQESKRKTEENRLRVAEERRLFREQKEKEKASGGDPAPAAPSAQLSRATVSGTTTAAAQPQTGCVADRSRDLDVSFGLIDLIRSVRGPAAAPRPLVKPKAAASFRVAPAPPQEEAAPAVDVKKKQQEMEIKLKEAERKRKEEEDNKRRQEEGACWGG